MQLVILFVISFVVYAGLAAVPGLGWIASVPLLGFLGSVMLVSVVWNKIGGRMTTARIQRRTVASLGRVDTPAIQGKLGAALLQAGRPTAALEPLQKARLGEPHELEWAWRLAVAQASLGKHAEALRELEFLLAGDEEYAYGRALLLSARLLARVGRRDEAVRACERFEANHGAEPEGLYELGAVLAANGDRAGAKSAFARAAREAADAARFKRRVDPWLGTKARLRALVGR